MSNNTTVFTIMRDLNVDYETIRKIAQSAKINVIKSPNSQLSPRHLKKILQAAENYKSTQAEKSTQELQEHNQAQTEQAKPKREIVVKRPPTGTMTGRSISLEQLQARTGRLVHKIDTSLDQLSESNSSTHLSVDTNKSQTDQPKNPETPDRNHEEQPKTYKDEFSKLKTILSELQSITKTSSGDVDEVLNLIEEASALYRSCHRRMKLIEQNMMLSSEHDVTKEL